MEWISVKDRLPEKNGNYLVVEKMFNTGETIRIRRFAQSLEDIDDYDFNGEHRPGWYDYDSECGFFEIVQVTHWMKLPKSPEEEPDKTPDQERKSGYGLYNSMYALEWSAQEAEEAEQSQI